MEITLQEIAAYLLFLFLQGLFVNGIKASSNGDTEISPSGRVIDGEMILYPLYKFIMQHTIRRDYYGDDLWEKIYKNTDFINCQCPLTYDDLIRLSKLVPAMFDNDIKSEIKGGDILFFKEYKEYKFSKYIRKPIIQCIICMPSFWGLFTYWPVISYLYGVNIFTVTLWVVNTVCLSYVCYLLYKPVK